MCFLKCKNQKQLVSLWCMLVHWNDYQCLILESWNGFLIYWTKIKCNFCVPSVMGHGLHSSWLGRGEFADSNCRNFRADARSGRLKRKKGRKAENFDLGARALGITLKQRHFLCAAKKYICLFSHAPRRQSKRESERERHTHIQKAN